MQRMWWIEKGPWNLMTPRKINNAKHFIPFHFIHDFCFPLLDNEYLLRKIAKPPDFYKDGGQKKVFFSSCKGMYVHFIFRIKMKMRIRNKERKRKTFSNRTRKTRKSENNTNGWLDGKKHLNSQLFRYFETKIIKKEMLSSDAHPSVYLNQHNIWGRKKKRMKSSLFIDIFFFCFCFCFVLLFYFPFSVHIMRNRRRKEIWPHSIALKTHKSWKRWKCHCVLIFRFL